MQPNRSTEFHSIMERSVRENTTLKRSMETSLSDRLVPHVKPTSSLTNEQLLGKALEALSANGSIEYTGEYGAELTTFIPFVAWLKQQGHLRGRKVVTYSGMRPYYFFLEDAEFSTKPDDRFWQPPSRRFWPSNRTETALAAPWHVYPDYRTFYGKRGRRFDRPILFVQNKFSVEWQSGPINYLPLNVLEHFLPLAIKRFHVIYSRPGAKLDGLGYSHDRNQSCDYPDLQVVRSVPGVELFEEMCLRDDLDYNATKLEILAKAHHFISVQGGGAHLMAYFNNSALLVFHRRGPEYPDAYRRGPYKYLSNPSPLLLIARNTQQLLSGLDVIFSTEADSQGIRVHPNMVEIVEALRH
jgi:hypothetical protein